MESERWRALQSSWRVEGKKAELLLETMTMMGNHR